MTIKELRARLDALGFVSTYDEFEDGDARLIVAKRFGVPGHRLAGQDCEWTMEEAGTLHTVHIDEPAPEIEITASRILFDVSCGVPSSPGAYQKELPSLDDVLEEIRHYFFDPTSRMSLEPGFEAWKG